MAAFDEALKFTLQWEGGYSNNPNDPGGATMKGITQAVYTAYLAAGGLPNANVQNITDAQVQDIYQTQYWTKAHCDTMPPLVAVAVFDLAVNGGVNRAITLLQTALGVTADGIFGPNSSAALNTACSSPFSTALFLGAYLYSRDEFYRNLAANNTKLATFLNGWLNRVSSLRTYIISQAGSASNTMA